MPSLPSNNTECWFLDYQSATTQHSMLMRTTPGQNDVGVSAAYDSFLNTLNADIDLMTVIGLRVRALGSTITNPRTWHGSATYGTGAPAPYAAAQYIDFIGRSHLGPHARVSVFGYKFTEVGGDYRVNPGESGAATAAIAELATGTVFWIAIDGTKPTWYPYANCGVNAYWRNKIR